MTATVDFTAMQNEAIAKFVQDHHADFDEKADDGKADRILESLSQGTVIARRPYGFAVVHPIGSLHPRGHNRSKAVLWYLYVVPEYRGNGQSEKFVQELVATLPKSGSCELLCHGEGRRSFFEKCGFQVSTSYDDGSFAMLFSPT